MISYQTEGVKMPDIKKKETTGWIKEVAACYGKEWEKSPTSSVRTIKFWK